MFGNKPEDALFSTRVCEAAEWCALRTRVEDPAGSLRSAELLPSLIRLEDENQASWNYEIEEPSSVVEDLCRKRAELLREAGSDSRRVADPFSMGRILVFYPRDTLVDGAAWLSSEGYFDYWNIPPWDTWVWFYPDSTGKDALYSWVPQEFVGLVSEGVFANPEQCIEWLTEV